MIAIAARWVDARALGHVTARFLAQNFAVDFLASPIPDSNPNLVSRLPCSPPLMADHIAKMYNTQWMI